MLFRSCPTRHISSDRIGVERMPRPLPEPGAPISSRRIALLRSQGRHHHKRRRVGQARILPPRVSGVSQASMESMWADLVPVGRDGATGGYRRHAWEPADLACREWFAAEAARRGLDLVVDRNGNQWAWWGDPDTAGQVGRASCRKECRSRWSPYH